MNHLALLCILIHLVGVNCYRDPITNAFVTLIQQLDDEMKNQESYDELGLVQRRQHTQPIYPETYEEKQPDLSYAPISDTFPQVKVGNKLIIGSTLAESHAFYSIPYAKPPTGDLRFMPPVAIDNLTETLNASLPDFRMCYQIKNCDDGDCNEFLMTEDCLVLNINVPSSIDLSDPEREPEGDKIPVMFYIHGGFFFEGRGTTPKTDGRWLSEAAKSIVVTINYRVGPLGFLLFEENGQLIEGNQGFKDQQLALKWVYENIGKFGGDSQRIMIFGESSGAQSVEYHLLARNSESYFLSAITESNPAVFPFQTVEKSLGVTDRVLEVINCTDIACLRASDPEVITNSRNEVMTRSLLNGELFNGIEPFRPYMDGVEFTDQHLNLFQEGKWQAAKHVIFGTNNDEMVYVSAAIQATGIKLNKKLFKALNELVLGSVNGEIVSEAYIATAGPNPGKNYDYSTIFGQQVTDLFFVCPNRALARFASQTSDHLNNSQVPIYLFNNAYALSKPACLEAFDFDPVCGYAFHSSEIVFVFKSPQGYNITFTDNDTLASDIFTSYWSGLAMCGNPRNGCSNLQLDAAVDWPPYSLENNWNNILIDVPHSAVQSNYREDFCDMLDATGFYVNITKTTTPKPILPQTTTTVTDITTTGNPPTTTNVPTPTNTENIDMEKTTSGARSKHQLGSILIFQFLFYVLLKAM